MRSADSLCALFNQRLSDEPTSELSTIVERILVAVGILSIVTNGYFPLGPSGLPFTVSQLLVEILFVMQAVVRLNWRQVSMPRRVVVVSILVIALSVTANLARFDSQTAKTILGLLVFFFAFYWLATHRDTTPQILMRAYCRATYFVVAIAFVQEVGALLHVPALYELSRYGFASYALSFNGPLVRLTSVFSEPARFAIFLVPASIVAMDRLLGEGEAKVFFRSKFFAIGTLVAAALTFSLVMYVSLFILIIYRLLTSRRVRTRGVLLIVVGLIGAAAITVSSTRSRLLTIRNIGNVAQSTAALSTFAIVSNALVSWEVFLHRPLIGSGFDTHEQDYYQYIDEFFPQRIMDLNTKTGGSLYINALSDLGLVGVFWGLYLWLGFRSVRKRDVGPWLTGTVRVSITVREAEYVSRVSWISLPVIVMRSGLYLSAELFLLVALLLATWRFLRFRSIDATGMSR